MMSENRAKAPSSPPVTPPKMLTRGAKRAWTAYAIFVALSIFVGIYYIFTAGPHVLHYLSYNLHCPGLRLFRSGHFARLEDILGEEGGDFYATQPRTAISSPSSGPCKGCELIQPYNENDEQFKLVAEARQRKFACRKLKAWPYNHLCLRPYSTDQISFAWTLFGYYELHYRVALAEAFRLFPDAGFIDLGSNFGSHSLYVAAAFDGVKVVSLDANPVNLRMLHRSAEINRLTGRISVLWNALSDVRGNVTMEWQRGTNLEGNSGRCDGDPSCELRAKAGSQVFQVPSITLNDLARHIPEQLSGQLSIRKWIVKIDIEGQESQALAREADDFFAHADNTFQVPIVLMEYRTALITHQLQRTRNMVKKFYEWNYCPYGYTAGMTGYYPIRSVYFEDWPHDVILIKQPQLCNREFFEKHERIILGAF